MTMTQYRMYNLRPKARYDRNRTLKGIDHKHLKKSGQGQIVREGSPASDWHEKLYDGKDLWRRRVLNMGRSAR